jgi:hypothetical protein
MQAAQSLIMTEDAYSLIQHDFFASCPRGAESLLANELNALGARGV